MPKKGTLEEIVKGTVTDENKKGTTYRTLIENTYAMTQELATEAATIRRHQHGQDGKPVIPME